jgi:uncharacterized protein YecE (DUF72 family)
VTEGALRIGTSGWSYPKGRGTWNGIFYPAAAPGPRGGTRRVDELAYYAERFDTVEVNSTFYRPVAPSVAASWAARTPPHFEFAVKLYQKFTHPAMFAKATGKVDTSISQADVDAVLRGLAPLAEAGKLGPLLVQFPPSFKADPGSFDHLAWLLRTFSAHALAVELRDRTWSDRIDETLALLGEHGATWAHIDEPKFRSSIRQTFSPPWATQASPLQRSGSGHLPGFHYVRLHGRNAAQWWKHDATEDRYNYLYSADELQPFVEQAQDARRVVKKLYLYTNNHFEAKSVANAVMLKRSLGEPIPGTYPGAFVERYPELRGIVETSGE